MVLVGLEEGAGALEVWRERRGNVTGGEPRTNSEKGCGIENPDSVQESEDEVAEMEVEWGWIWREYLGGGEEVVGWEARLEMGL